MDVTNTKIPISLASLALVLMLGISAWQGYVFWQQEPDFQPVLDTPSTRAGQQKVEVPSESLAGFPVFGVQGREPAPVQDNLDNLPETNLQLTLRGVLAANGEFPGSALIEDNKRNTDAYLVGDELPGNAVLKVVRADRIVIERSGKLENLYFPADEDRSGLEIAAQTEEAFASQTAPQESQSFEQRDTSQPAMPEGADTEQRREEIRRRLEQLRERLRSNN